MTRSWPWVNKYWTGLIVSTASSNHCAVCGCQTVHCRGHYMWVCVSLCHSLMMTNYSLIIIFFITISRHDQGRQRGCLLPNWMIPPKMMYFHYIDKKNLIAHGSDLETENNVAIISMSFHDYLSRHSECRTVG